MSELLADIVSAGRELDAASLEKTRRYLEALEPAVRPDDLPAYGLAYLEQLHNPDPRYSRLLAGLPGYPNMKRLADVLFLTPGAQNMPNLIAPI